MQIANRQSKIAMLAWQGWQIRLPPGCNPLKLEGDFARGQVLVADMKQPRFGMRWSTPAAKKIDAYRWVNNALREEVGRLAADEARSCASENWIEAKIYSEPSPPGRDLWVAYSKMSGRLIQIVCPVDSPECRCVDGLILSLSDSKADAELSWSVFGLSCRTPPHFRLASNKLNAGDLTLNFQHQRRRLSVRQIGIADLALKRKTLAQWLEDQQRKQKQYRSETETATLSLATNDGRKLEGMRLQMHRRRRLFWARHLPAKTTMIALHDAHLNRLVLADSSDEMLAEKVAKSVGWADVNSGTISPGTRDA
jgi:hypothetical protein